MNLVVDQSVLGMYAGGRTAPGHQTLPVLVVRGEIFPDSWVRAYVKKEARATKRDDKNSPDRFVIRVTPLVHSGFGPRWTRTECPAWRLVAGSGNPPDEAMRSWTSRGRWVAIVSTRPAPVLGGEPEVEDWSE
jgi:hypothetical protein